MEVSGDEVELSRPDDEDENVLSRSRGFTVKFKGLVGIAIAANHPESGGTVLNLLHLWQFCALFGESRVSVTQHLIGKSQPLIS